MSDTLVKVTEYKPSKKTGMGLGFCSQDGIVLIASIEGNSPFFSSFEPGFQVFEVEGVSMAGRTSIEAANLVRNAEHTVTIVAREHVAPLSSFSPLPASKKDNTSDEPEAQVDVESPAPNTEPDIEIPVAAAVFSPTPTTAAADPESEAVQFEAPSDLPEGYKLEAEVNGEPFFAVVPLGGVKQGNLLSAHTKSVTLKQQIPRTTTEQKQQVIDFEAPSDLPEGYNLEVEANGQRLLVTIPEGGVKMGHILSIPVSPPTEQAPTDTDFVPNTSNTSEPLMPVPRGKWRDGFCECCQHCGRPVFWTSWCAYPVSLGQVLTRLNLNWVGDKEQFKDQSAFIFFLVAWIVMMVYYLSFLFTAISAFCIAFFVFYIFTLVIIIKARGHIRRQYGIQGSGCEDCCLAYWCGCCTLIQMSGHTADFQQYKSKCCTPTGLISTAPPNQRLLLPTEKDAPILEAKKNRRLWLMIVAVVVFLLLLVIGVVLAVTTESSPSNLRGDSGSSSSSTGSSPNSGGSGSSSYCSYKYCPVPVCGMTYDVWAEEWKYKCTEKYQYMYKCGPC